MSKLTRQRQRIENYKIKYCLDVDNQQIEFAPSGRQEIDVDAPNRILCVSVTNIVHAVNVDVLAKVFENYGPIFKVLICPRPNGIQAFVELETTEKAVSAKADLDGKNLYHDCNFIRITFSRFQQLEIRHQGELQADFTLQGRPEESPGSDEKYLSNLRNKGVSGIKQGTKSERSKTSLQRGYGQSNGRHGANTTGF